MTGLLGLSPAELAAASAAILFAAVLRGFTGFGFAIAGVPLASLVLPPARVVAAALLMQLAVGLRDCVMEWRHADGKAIGRLVLGAVAGMPLGVLALVALDPAVVRLVLGLLVLLAVVLTWRPRPARRPPGWPATVATGLASGLLHGLAAMAGPPAVAYFLAFERRLVVMRSSLMVYFPVVSLLGLPMAAAAGLLDRSALLLGLLGMPLVIGGGWAGGWAFRRFGARTYRPLALAALLATALLSIGRALPDLLP